MKIRILWVTIYKKIPATACLFADNINGPSERTILRNAAKLDVIQRSIGGRSIIDKTDEVAFQKLCG